jgi:hypothetical protein
MGGEGQKINKHKLDSYDENSKVSAEEGSDMRLVVAI